MKILVITTFYAPDLGAGAALYEMLCEDLVRFGHEVTVICAVPHYPSGRVADEFRGRVFSRTVRNGVNVIRVWVPSGDRSRLLHRLITFAAFQLFATAVGLPQKYDVVLGGNPALEIFLPYQVLAVLRRKPAVFSVHDLYPDAGVKLGIFHHRPVIKAVGALEHLCLSRSDYVRVLSEGLARSIRKRGIPQSRIALIFDWLDTEFLKPEPRSNSFSRQFGLDDRFVVQYAGNIGLSQGLETVLEAARMLAADDQIHFALVGDGANRRELEQSARVNGPRNVSFIPFQPRERLPEVLASSDLSLISLRRGISSDSVPSKFYSIIAAGKPLAAAVDLGSDTARLIENARCGVCVPPEDPRALADAVLRLYRDERLRDQLGRNGRDYVVANHSRENAAAKFNRLLSGLCRNSI